MLSQSKQPLRKSPELDRLEALPRPIVAFARDLKAGQEIARHRHRRAQLVYAQSGVITVTAESGIWVIPPQRAVWMPVGMDHSIRAGGRVAMRNIYVDAAAAAGLPGDCRVVNITPLLRELILRAFELPALYDEDGPEGRLMAVILDQLEHLPVAGLHLPLPADERLQRITRALQEHPADGRSLAQWARLAGATSRTISRLFLKETGMTFGAWRRQARLLKALEALGRGEPVTTVALDLGYESPSAFIAMFRRAFGMPPGRYFTQPKGRNVD